jgi:hypothetical protein
LYIEYIITIIFNYNYIKINFSNFISFFNYIKKEKTMNKKYMILSLVTLTGAPCWGAAWDVAAFCKGAAECIARWTAAPAAPQEAQVIASQKANNKLLSAVKEGDVKEVKEALGERANPNAANRHGYTALMLAAMARDKEKGMEIAQILIAKGADIEATDSTGRTALMYAAQHGNIGVVEVLIESKANVYAKDKGGLTALSFARLDENVSEEARKAKRIIREILTTGQVRMGG